MVYSMPAHRPCARRCAGPCCRRGHQPGDLRLGRRGHADRRFAGKCRTSSGSPCLRAVTPLNRTCGPRPQGPPAKVEARSFRQVRAGGRVRRRFGASVLTPVGKPPPSSRRCPVLPGTFQGAVPALTGFTMRDQALRKGCEQGIGCKGGGDLARAARERADDHIFAGPPRSPPLTSGEA